jgi:Ni/Fe-hydrogenase subunit HybB-like protein
VTLSVAAWDWGMSLEPEWFSTMYGVLVFAGTLQGGIAGVTVLALLLDRQGRLDAPLGDSGRHDLGKLLFAFSTFWAYVWFCQFLLIWYANLPEETGHHAARLTGGWGTLFWLNPILCFVAPFVTQLSQTAKREPRILYQAALVVLLGRWLDTYLLVAPSQGPVPAFPLGAIAATVTVLAGMRLLWERDRGGEA